jgi:hypothetical protein
MRDRTGPPPSPTRRKLSFKASTTGDPLANAITVPLRGSAGDPTTFGAVLSVANASGSGERVDVALPAVGWTADGSATTPTAYRWTAASRTDPVSRIIVRANRLRIRAGGGSWTYTLNETRQGAIAVKLRLGTAAAWCASAPAKTSGTPPSSASFDRVDRFVAARNTPPPVVCPAP